MGKWHRSTSRAWAVLATLALTASVLGSASGCARRFELKDVAGPDGRVPVLVVIEPSALPRFEAHHEVSPGDVVREATAISRGLQSKTGERPQWGSTLEKVVPAPALEDLSDASAVLADHLSGRWSKQRTLKPPPSTACVLEGAAPEVPAECSALPLTLRVQVRALRFDAMPGELLLRTFIADASLENRAKKGSTVWTARCDLKSLDVPEIPGARTASEVNQILERAAQVCAEKLELSLRTKLF